MLHHMNRLGDQTELMWREDIGRLGFNLEVASISLLPILMPMHTRFKQQMWPLQGIASGVRWRLWRHTTWRPSWNCLMCSA